MTPDEIERLGNLITALRGRFNDQGEVDKLIEEGVLTSDIVARLLALAAGADNSIQGIVSNDGRIYGPAVGVNLGSIIYGHDPTEEQHERLVSYLRPLSNSLDSLHLGGMIERLERDDSLSLPGVYVMLATKTSIPLPHDCDLTHYFDIGTLKQLQSDAFTPSNPLISLVKDEYQPDIALPDRAIIEVERMEVTNSIQIKLFRAQLATEALHERRHLVLLGDPGGGKSTFVQHLAWALAQRGIDRLDDHTRLFGWTDTTRLLPVILPLRTLASCLASRGTVIDALRDQITAISDLPASAAMDMLVAALDHNATLLLFDGLDEVPQESVAPTPQHAGSADRQAVLLAVTDFVKRHRENLALITCRTRACAPEVWQSLGWPVERLAPFTLGQMRHFVRIWYNELANKGLTTTQARRYTQVLQTALEQNDKMRMMGGTPLLLAMMTLLLYHDPVLPPDPPALYERILKLLLGKWDKHHEGQNLAEAIGYPGWDSERFQPLLDRLSYEAHATASSADGRGQLSRSHVRDKLIEFFKSDSKSSRKAAMRYSAADTAERYLEYIEQRSGLLLPDRVDTYIFAHLTLQEYCAGRSLVIPPDAVKLVMDHRKDDRWREPIFLGLGFIKGSNPALVSEVLTRLTEQEEYGEPKPVKRWYDDLILAAEIGAYCDWSILRIHWIDTAWLQKRLRIGLTTLLEECTQTLPIEERIRAGLLLGDLEDPRIPLFLDDWRREIGQAMNVDTTSNPAYWRYVRAGTYGIGGASDLPEIKISLPAFWISRFTVTVAQYDQFIEEGGYQFDQWWTPIGQQWKRTVRRQRPAAFFDSLKSNQPVIGVAWYEAAAWAEWLNRSLADILPPNFEIRLPTEAEWEAACYNSAMEIPAYPWGNEEPTPDLAIYDQCNLNEPAPVGICPHGATASGASDMGGNVWEWTTTKSSMYPHQSHEVRRDFQGFDHIAIRGGSFRDKADSLRTRNRHLLRSEGDFYRGFRIVLAPQQ